MLCASLVRLPRSIGALIATVLLCGCEQGVLPAEQVREPHATSSEHAEKRDPREPADAFEARERAARIARLSAEIDAAVAQRTELQQQRAAIDAQRAVHEERGRAMLESLKSQMQEQARKERDDEAFKSEARAQLETVLAQDDELTASLQDLDRRISATSVQIDTLSDKRKRLQQDIE